MIGGIMFKIFLGSQLLAIVNMLYLSFVHYNLKFGIRGDKSLCNINDTFNCDVVNLSPYAVLLGTPLSLWGFFANLVLLLLGFWILIEEKENKKYHIYSLLLLLAGLIALTSVILGVISFFVLEAYCLFCLLAYLLSFISLGAIFKWKNTLSFKTKADIDFSKSFKLYLPILLIAPITLMANEIIKSNLAGQMLKQLDALFLDWQDSPPLEITTEGALVYSSHTQPAKMNIIEFADFQCPHCQVASGILHTFIKSRDDVELTFMSFPLDGACNEAIPRSSNGRSCWLAFATYCADQQDKGWQMHDYLFEKVTEVRRSDLTKIAQKINLNESSFSECLDANSTLEAIKAQAREGENAKITGTPSLFINGKHLPSGVTWVMLEKIYNSL